MGPAGNLEPTHDIPTVIADRLEKVNKEKQNIKNKKN